MRIEQFLYITEIAKTGSIATAAERLYVTSPGISLAISSLEKELGVKIFERSRTGLEPTETGKKLILKAQNILNCIEEFKDEAKIDSSDIKGHLSISSDPALCRSIMPKTSAELKVKFPGITLQIKESPTSQVRKDVLNGDADIGLVFYPSSSPKENQLLTTTHIIDSIMMLCFKKNSELASKDIITMKDIDNYPLAAILNENDRKYHSQIFGKHNKLNILVQSQNSETKKYFISQGLAVGFEPDLTIKSDPFYQGGDIIAKPVLGIDLKVSYFSIRLKRRFFSAAEKKFLKELQYQASYFKE
ncbi:LysR family transcriptional regulator [Bacillus sp. CRN 9]|uniref:LysR family transcriptional regulator n=1 Tax=Cytobacillus horneckiae TaxID=549687 RepID=UPI001562E63F|nr:LysR family transcriptional regulator [Bacillus sp. CRN 9]